MKWKEWLANRGINPDEDMPENDSDKDGSDNEASDNENELEEDNPADKIAELKKEIAELKEANRALALKGTAKKSAKKTVEEEIKDIMEGM